MSPLAQAFLDICNEEGNTTTIEGLRNKALEQLATGNVTTLVSSTINGKSFNFQVSLAADKLFAEASWCIAQYNKGIIVASEFDFTGI